MTKEGQVILASNKLDRGQSKKVNEAKNLSTGETMVKISVKGYENVKNVLIEEK
ncbi:MAG: hypothetical protein HWD61_01385 [Parachlamydiaceae bacterium]|nr:MAG: hypothetical protein HWD61_01385 [Parachlamydiaceae bacterium]